MGSSPMPTKLTEHITRSMHMAPDVKSLNRWTDTMEDPIIWVGPWSLASSGGMPVTTLSELSPCRDWAISANPGGGIGGWLLASACHGMTSQVRVACVVVWAVTVVGGPAHPLPWATKKDPLGWAQQVLLWLCCHWVGSTDLDSVIFTQLEGGMSSRTFSSVKVVSSSIVCCRSKTLLPIGEAHWGSVVGPFLSSIEGPLHRLRSSRVV